VRADLPAGTVTFLFTDVEGSTKLLHELGAEAYADALAEHRRVIRETATAHGGVEVDTQGDAFFIAFPTAPGALATAAAAREALGIPVRMGIHAGTPLLTEEGYVGPDVHRAARIAAAGHGGQILVSSAAAALVDSQLRDLGPHRLKDLSAPERIYQFGDDDFPPLKSLHQTNLPVPATPFLGRERELPEVVQLLSDDDVRLLTLTGPGGTGKTRLGLQAAASLAGRYPDGVWWIPLAPLRDPQLVLTTASQTLGASDGVAEHIADKAMLVLFDNFEQVVDAAADIAELLAACPRLEVLVTSREPLHVSGEQEYAVPPLAHDEGVGFFVARARAVVADFEPDENVSEICGRLDDLPLALELAAARVKALSTAQILARLEQRLPLLTGSTRDAPERQRTLRATIEWSYELLTDEEQRLFVRLGVFRGGSTLEAAEQIAAADVDQLQSLVDKSLLRRARDRYWMLETIREFASERLDDETRGRHAEYFLELAEEAEPHLRGSPQVWLDRLQAEHDNLRAAADYFAVSAETESALRLGGALWKFWHIKGYLAEGARELERALAADDQPTPVRATALSGAAALVLNLGRIADAKRHANDSLALHSRFENAWGIAYSYLLLGNIATEESDFEQARELMEESVTRFADLRDEHYSLLATDNLAWISKVLGDTERAEALHADVAARARGSGNDRMAALALGGLATIVTEADRTDEALPLLGETLPIWLELGDRHMLARDLGRLARALALQHQPAVATSLLSCAERLYEEIGSHESWRPAETKQTVGLIRRDLDEAVFSAAWAEGRALTPADAVELALEHCGLAE
jgi:predicted ATPase